MVADVESKKLCCCPCGCKSSVENPLNDRCDYCLEWHDYNDEDLEDE